MNDKFELYTIEVSVVGDPETFACSHEVGPALRITGENIQILGKGTFSLYALSTLLPLIPAKQRMTHENDWMTTDELIACPDPYCGARFKLARVGLTEFSHSEVTKVPLSGASDDKL